MKYYPSKLTCWFFIVNLLLALSARAQRSRSDVVKCNDKCRKCSDKLNPYENRCENSISLKGIELKGITEEEIRCCEYRFNWHCLMRWARNVCTEDETRDTIRFADYNVENVLGSKCADVRYGERFCRSRSSPETEPNHGLSTAATALLVTVWLSFELKCT